MDLISPHHAQPAENTQRPKGDDASQRLRWGGSFTRTVGPGLGVSIAEAWRAYAGGKTEEGLELMKKAAEMEASTTKNPVTPSEVLPAIELYGDMLRDAGRYDEAAAQYEAALARSPNRFNSLYGAGRAAELTGDEEAATSYYRELVGITDEAAAREELAHAREYLSTKEPT